jgi:DNA-binding NarL/FixJ family response regulator
MDPRVRLTSRELDVIDVIHGGARSFSDIARELEPPVSPRTVEAHVRAISRKIGDDFEPRLTPLLRVIFWTRDGLPGA